jgi:hypothetical protein
VWLALAAGTNHTFIPHTPTLATTSSYLSTTPPSNLSSGSTEGVAATDALDEFHEFGGDPAIHQGRRSPIAEQIQALIEKGVSELVDTVHCPPLATYHHPPSTRHPPPVTYNLSINTTNSPCVTIRGSPPT